MCNDVVRAHKIGGRLCENARDAKKKLVNAIACGAVRWQLLVCGATQRQQCELKIYCVFVRTIACRREMDDGKRRFGAEIALCADQPSKFSVPCTILRAF